MLPVPAAFVVDQKGVIRFVYYNPDIKVRVNPDDLLKAAKEAR
jgi:peroxiredoxin